MTLAEVEITSFAILATIALLSLDVLLAILACWRAEKKGYSFFGFMFLTIGVCPIFKAFAPPLMLGVALLLPRR